MLRLNENFECRHERRNEFEQVRKSFQTGSEFLKKRSKCGKKIFGQGINK